MRAKALFILLACLFGQAQAMPIPNQYQFKNGLQLFHVKDSRAPVAIVQVWYQVGSQDETRGATGISHMLEHMMFKGTRQFGPGETSRIVAEMGGDENAFTSHDYTGYYQIVPKEALDKTLMIEADRMVNLSIRPKEFEKERLVVLEERRQRIETSPFGFALHHFNQLAYENTPYHHPIIGWLHDIKSWKPKDAMRWYREYYHPSNAMIVVVGDVAFNDVKKAVQKHFASIKNHKKKTARPEVSSPDYLQGKKSITLKKDFRQTYLLKGFKVPGIRVNEVHSYALDIMAELLGGGSNSYLYKTLVMEKNIATQVATDFSLLTWGNGQFLIYAEPTPGTSVETLELEINQALVRFRKVLEDDRQLARAKMNRLSSLVFNQDNLFEVARLIGHAAVLNLPIDFIERYKRGIDALEASILTMVYDQYLRPSNSTTLYLKPTAKGA